MDTDGKFYLGRLYDTAKNKLSDNDLLYDPDDLTTHAVVVGMTGSGKTGLCIDLLEEAALNNIPALMIDPKGDITNALLHFPDLLPADFEPWVNPDEARREGKTIAEAAKDAAELWSGGLEKWGIGKERILALSNAAHFAVYTPGSDAGIPVNILASLQAPEIPWKGNEEALRERVAGTVTAILGLVGMQDIDPVQSREHILLANLFEAAWSKGEDLDISELILRTQSPPFEKLGVFDMNTFFPEKDRFALAMRLNNILASPSFQSWIEGAPLEIESLLYGPDKRPRHSVFYLAHLSDAERMFFVTLLYSAVDTWMRKQKGSTALRAIMYFDEIFGYVPPVSNPPSKPLILSMLKMARAFGVAQVLVTQNPVDLDYKGLSNAGTWFIGKLQTERDKERLLDGLEGAAAGTKVNRSQFDKIISALDKRVFLLHNVHEAKPQVFQTRWAMNYLTGPLTRAQIPALNELAGASAGKGGGKPEKARTPTATPKKAEAKESRELGTATRPAIPGGVGEYFLPNNLTLAEAAKASGAALSSGTKRKGMLYKPVLLAQADIRYLERRYDLDREEKRSAVVAEPDKRGAIRWEEHLGSGIDPKSLDRAAAPEATFATLEAPLSEDKLFKSMEADFIEWAYRDAEVQVWANEELKVYAGPDVSEGEFRKLCSEAARKARDEEVKKIQSKYKTRITSVQKKLARERRELTEDETELSQRKLEEMGTHAENLLGLFGGSRRRLSTSLTKRRMTEQAKADVEESLQEIQAMENELVDLTGEIETEIDEIEERWADVANDITQIAVAPLKKDILVELFGVAWMPYHLVEVDGKLMELPGFGS
jgi:hypothetical protein